MKVITIGTDRNLFDEKSAVLSRQMEYASKMEGLHIIVFALKKDSLSKKDQGNLHIYPTNSRSKWFYILDAIKIGKEIIEKNGLSKGDFIVTTQDPFESGLVGYKLKKIFHFPLQIQIHTDFLSSYFKSNFLNRIRVFISKFVIPKADGIRVVSSVIADSVKNKFPNLKAKVDILPIFVDIENILVDQIQSQINFPQFDFIVFMASRLEREKRIDVALYTLQKVISKFTRVGLVISGDGTEKNNLENLTNKLGISKNVIFLGWQDDARLYYQKSYTFLLTSEFEGYGMALIEAGAAGCPIVTTNVGIAKTNLFKDGENSFVCPVGDVDCLSDSVIKLISDPAKRSLFKERMRDSIRRVSISREQYMPQYIGLLEKLLKN